MRKADEADALQEADVVEDEVSHQVVDVLDVPVVGRQEAIKADIKVDIKVIIVVAIIVLTRLLSVKMDTDILVTITAVDMVRMLILQELLCKADVDNLKDAVLDAVDQDVDAVAMVVALDVEVKEEAVVLMRLKLTLVTLKKLLLQQLLLLSRRQ